MMIANITLNIGLNLFYAMSRVVSLRINTDLHVEGKFKNTFRCFSPEVA